MSDEIALLMVPTRPLPFDETIARVYGPGTRLGAPGPTFGAAANGHRPAAVEWNAQAWIFDRSRIAHWFTAAPVATGEAIALQLDPQAGIYGYALWQDGRKIAGRRGVGETFEVTPDASEKAYEHRGLGSYWPDAPEGAAETLVRGGRFAAPPPPRLRRIIVLDALGNHFYVSPFGEHADHFTNVPVHPIL